MSFAAMLRRATTTSLSRALRSTKSVHGPVSAAVSGERQSASLLRNFLPIFHFSTATNAKKPASDDNLIRVLDSEIECVEVPADVESLPDGFPFEIEDNPGERTISLKRVYQDEVIKVEVDMPNIPGEDDDDDQDNEDSSIPSSIPLVVNISKESGQCLEFGITAFPDEVTIDSLSIKNPAGSEDELAYEGPDFSDLDENLQKAFLKYLEIRGIKPSTTNFLFDYMNKKDNKEYLLWLKNIKEFMEK